MNRSSNHRPDLKTIAFFLAVLIVTVIGLLSFQESKAESIQCPRREICPANPSDECTVPTYITCSCPSGQIASCIGLDPIFCVGGGPTCYQSYDCSECSAIPYTYSWQTDLWGSCSVTSGTCGGSQTRSVWCERSDGVIVADSFCDPATKPDTSQSCIASSGTTCRASAGICDLAETCDGVSSSCPSDSFVSSSTICNPSAGTCDIAETCTGTNALCPSDGKEPSSTICRTGGGDPNASGTTCDPTEFCTGSSNSCPADSYQPSTTICRSAGSSITCDPAEYCPGVPGGFCPANNLASAGTLCLNGTVCDGTETCDGSGACSSGTPLNCNDGNQCTADSCDAVSGCASTNVPNGTACTGGTCQSGICVPTGGCTTNADCNDSNPCSIDTCNVSTGVCSNIAGNAGSTCRASTGECDITETCTGSSTVCPVNGFLPDGTPCTGGTCSSGVCVPTGSPPPISPPPPPPPETLSVSLTATPSTGSSPLNTQLEANISGTATGTINYSFWWNCTNTSNSVATVTTACGALPSPSLGNCSSNTVGYKCLAVNTNPQGVSHSYTSNSTAKVIAERGSASPAEARVSITISGGGPNSPPAISDPPGVTFTEPDYCVSGPAVFVNWTYSDPNGDPQSAYQVQIDDQGSFASPAADSGKITCIDCRSYFASGLEFDITYKARARVWDSNDAVSSWKTSGSWKTPKHAYPLVNFTWTPLLNPTINQPIQFTDQSQFFDDTTAPGQRGWEWLFGDGGSSDIQNPIHAYLNAGLFNVTETVTDKDGLECSLTKPINIQRPIPIWKEVGPR